MEEQKRAYILNFKDGNSIVVKEYVITAIRRANASNIKGMINILDEKKEAIDYMFDISNISYIEQML